MAVESRRTAGLARRLRELREQHGENALTQAQLAAAFSAEAKVAAATISSWESTTAGKVPTGARLEAYARFFATPRSLDGNPHLVAAADLEPDEHERYQVLERELLDLLRGDRPERRSTFRFDEGPITVICSEVPAAAQGALAREDDPNFTRLQQFADLDALLELYGHLRASNPTLEVNDRLPRELVANDLSTHVVLVGGIAWNRLTRRLKSALRQLPVRQIDAADYEGGDPFEIVGDRPERVEPVWDKDERGERELLEDVAFVARLPNPFNARRTLTVCSGVHSRGVLGAVRCLTDRRLGDANEHYLAEHFAAGPFALLIRVPVIGGETLSPDLQNPAARLYEWPGPGRHPST